MVSLLSSKVLRCMIALIRIYQRISQLINPHCRFYPTCSEYSIKALYRFGLIIGSWLTIKRVLKCHPLNSGGKDPVPSSKKFDTKEY